MAARCRKFVPNLFNKTKCQSCFGAKEAHSAEALESSKAARKISKCAFLFVSPDLDFSNPLQRTKRWQRRFFILYDDGELTYSVDDNPSTIPQGSVDMNKCNDVFDAEEKTGHEFSIGITVPGPTTPYTTYVKGTSKDEIRRWFDVLVMYPRSLTVKTKRSPGSKAGASVSRHLSYYPPTGTDKSVSDDEDADSVHSKSSMESGVEPYERSGRTRGRYRQKDMRRSKSEVRPSDLKMAEDEFNKKNETGKDGQAKKDKVDGPVRRAGEPETFSSVRSMKHRKAAKSQAQPPTTPTATEPKATESAAAKTPDQTVAGVTINQALGVNRRLSIPNLTGSSKIGEHKGLSRTASAAGKTTSGAVGGGVSAFVYPPPSTPSTSNSANLPDANETDEHKLAKNEHARMSLEKSPIVRKGWLLVRQDAQSNVWSKHWFVLCGTSLSYYKDAKAEETNTLDGVIDVASAYEVSSIKAERNHGFRIKTKEGEYTLSAMTSGIRRNWIEAVEGIIAEIRRAREKSAKQDMGFVFESPIRSPRTPSITAAPVTTTLAPVVPDSSSRVNNALREMAERRRETGDDRPLAELYDVVPGAAANPTTTATTTTDRKDSACSDTEREVSSLTSKQDTSQPGAGLPPLKQPSTDVSPAPKSPSAFVSPSQRIKEKSRSKTPPRTRSPPPPSPTIPATSAAVPVVPISSKPSTPVDRMLLLPTGNSSDENDESLNAKLLESQKQVQHLQQQVQDVNSMIRKQRVEIESLQTKLDLTTSQLHDMETALTHSAQNLNKERKNVSRLTEALENAKRGQGNTGVDQSDKSARLERQLQDATHKIAAQEVKMAMVSGLEEQLQIRTSKLATLEKVLGNTRRHLQDAVENVRETEQTYQTKIEEIEQENEEERAELQDKIMELEEKLDKFVTESNNSVNTELSGQLMKEKKQSMQRLEELVKEQKGKIDQLTEENNLSRQQIDELQCYKDRAQVIQNQLDSSQLEYGTMRNTIQTLESSLESLRNDLRSKDDELITKCQENSSLLATIDELQNKCRLAQEGQSIVSDKSGVDYEQEREILREELESVTAELNSALISSHSEIEKIRQAHAEQTRDLSDSRAQVQSLTDRCSKLESELRKEKMKSMMTPPPPAAPATSSGSQGGGGFTLAQVIEFIGVVARSCERMSESAVAMLAGEMIETDIKAAINFNQEQRTAIGAKTVDQLVKKFAGLRQRLNWVVKNNVSKKMFDRLQAEAEGLKLELSQVPSQSADTTDSSLGRGDNKLALNNNNSDYLSALLDRCRAEILCISTDVTRLDISHVETKLQNLNTTLQQLDKQKSVDHFSSDMALVSYCNKLAVQAAAMFEMARTVSSGVDLSKILLSVENCLNATSGIATSIEDLSLRNYALLVSERLLISCELDNLINTGQWKGFSKTEQSDFTTKALVAETLQRIEAFTLSQGKVVPDTCLNSCINSLLHHNNNGRPSLELLKNETSLITQLSKNLNDSLHGSVRSYCVLYTSELVNFGSIEFSQVEGLLSSITQKLCLQIKQLGTSGKLSELSSEWIHTQLCTACDKIRGLDAKDLPSDFMELALKACMFEAKFEMSSSLISRRQTSTLSQSLLSEASKLAGLSSELAKKASVPGSTEEKIAQLAQRLEQTDRMLAGYAGHYNTTVQQVMREVVNSLQMSVMKFNLGTGEIPASPNEQDLIQQVEQLKLQLIDASERSQKVVKADKHEKAVEALHDQMSLLKVEHSTELDESKRDMKMVLKSVKAEEHRLATELTEQISQLKNQLADEKRTHQAELMKLQENRPDQVSAEDHAQLKDKVRDLENCLHEMQEEFEEELYDERRVHLAELDKTRAELLDVVTRADNQPLTSDEIHEGYEAVIDKLKAEQASLQQWIDDIREAHRDEIDALQHERDTALADEELATQAALDALKSAHNIELEQERSKSTELQAKTDHMVQVERDLLLQTRANENNEKRIADLEGKISASTRKVAKLDLNSKKSEDIIAELTSQNQKIVERNSQLVDKFTQELSKISSGSRNAIDGKSMALRAKLESLEEQLRLESLQNRQLEEKMEVMKTKYEQQLKQKEEERQQEPPRSSSASPSEDVLMRRRLRARSPSPHARRSSPPVFALSSSHAAGSINGAGKDSVDSKATSSPPRKEPLRSYDLSRSKSTPIMDKQMSIAPTRTKRLSGADGVPRTPPANLPLSVAPQPTAGLDKYRISGGISLADRMRKFT